MKEIGRRRQWRNGEEKEVVVIEGEEKEVVVREGECRE